MSDWQDMSEAPRDGKQILAARWNDCMWEYDVVFWCGDETYPWATSSGGGYPPHRLDKWKEIDGLEAPE